MDENMLQQFAQNLRKPEGEFGKQMGVRMNNGNHLMNIAAITEVDPQPDDFILEIGMGNGHFVRNIVSIDDSIHYIGVDFSQLMIDEANTINKEFVNGGQVSFVLGMADKLPFKENTFHKIFTVNTIYFWENVTDVLKEFKRILKPSGKLVLALRPASQMKQYPFVKYGFNLYSKEDVIKLLSDNGFKVLTIKENDEPDQEINGIKYKISNVIISAEKQN